MNFTAKRVLGLTLLLAASLLAACGNDDPATDDPGNGNGNGNGDTEESYFELPHAYGSYYHTFWGGAAGDYYLVLTDQDLDDANAPLYKHRIDIDFLSILSTDPDTARPLDGEYVVGNYQSNKAGIFLEGFLDFDPTGMPAFYGTYWNQPDEEEDKTTAHPIVGGKMTITTEAGITTVRAEFIDKNDSTLRVSYRGELTFENRANEEYEGDSRLKDNYALTREAVVTMKKIVDECTETYDRWDLHFYEKECYDTQGATGFYLWFKLVTPAGHAYIPSGDYGATTAPATGFLPGKRAETGPGTVRAVDTWLYGGRTPHAPITNGTLHVKTTDGTKYEVSFSVGDDHPIPYLVTGSYEGPVRTI